jgi:hypothetical protein
MGRYAVTVSSPPGCFRISMLKPCYRTPNAISCCARPPIVSRNHRTNRFHFTASSQPQAVIEVLGRTQHSREPLHVHEQHPCSGGAYGSVPFAGAPHTVGSCDESATASGRHVRRGHHTLVAFDCFLPALSGSARHVMQHADVPSGPLWSCSNVSS